MPTHSHGSHGREEEEKPCRACSDFKTWAQQQSVSKSSSKTSSPKSKDCPLNKEELGKGSWGLLHSVASYFPEKPTDQESRSMCRFMTLFAQFYPCEPCRVDFLKDVRKHPPNTKSRDELAKWLCERHNTVNRKLDKPVFDCSKVHERWKDGWLDGSCD